MFGNYLLLGIVLREWLRNKYKTSLPHPDRQVGPGNWTGEKREWRTDRHRDTLTESCRQLVHACSEGTPPRNAEPQGVGYDVQSLSTQIPEEGFAYSLIPAQGRLCQLSWFWSTYGHLITIRYLFPRTSLHHHSRLPLLSTLLSMRIPSPKLREPSLNYHRQIEGHVSQTVFYDMLYKENTDKGHRTQLCEEFLPAWLSVKSKETTEVQKEKKLFRWRWEKRRQMGLVHQSVPDGEGIGFGRT